ncbi:putative 2-succinyl-6-hydroxy-2,4-cyclohexadiene-1-carboxylate synthase [Kroppenstedtia guangzhouensis]|uniref:Putative 2-succinyl-6-hydroxy-2,4-cyclohexadiene-1-carboxylate synthase n=1 Tax=Kroppenstedtia guangzhouensis TaxID=1274356 RepID=A0ABQ1H0U3_9BACL|nr:2-succinyl-6-hydroxy-2,4-cyclohexadiene-1-carboxylate synthase [Kroppenstedtia guangzhouensis]GGA54755.1 putative 2-succinyl-6-hydroxy-2,4-cyclohexadiene-1-carboxylate synthase [Kroppenstedtia guangzhouensis]
MHFHVNGVSYRVESEGQGPALLLLHGFTGSRVTWEPYLSNWTRQFQVVRVDVIGHGESDAPADPARYTMDRATADLAEILDRLQISHAHVLGYSMGGRLALSFAEWYPDRVNTLLLESSSPGLKTDAERRARREQDEALADRIEREGLESFIWYWESIPLFASQANLPEKVRQALRKERLSQRAQGLANSLRGMGTGAQPSWWGHLGKIPCPVLLITGELDGKFCRIAKEMNGQFAQCQWRVVPGAGHAVHLEVPRLFDTIVMEFLLDQEIP